MTNLPQLAKQMWISAKETQAVIEALEDDGTEVRFVGGCVRNALVQQPITDIDIATPNAPDRVLELLKKSGIKAVPTGVRYGTITALIGKSRFEITTLRKDINSTGRHATVAFIDDWLEDANRRDFTINSMSASASGALYDPLNGYFDLVRGRVRFIGVARDRIAEDYLRILRFFRFHGQFGQHPMDRDAVSACRMFARKLRHLSCERVRDEFLKILQVRNPAMVCEQMHNEQILKHILPEATNLDRLSILQCIETKVRRGINQKPDAIRNLAALLTANKNDVAAAADRLKLSNLQKKRLKELTCTEKFINKNLSEIDQRQMIRHLGGERVRDLALLSWANELHIGSQRSRFTEEEYTQIIKRCEEWVVPHFPLSGDDVLALGLEPGRAIGEILREIEVWWEKHQYSATRQDCLNQLIRIVKRKS